MQQRGAAVFAAACILLAHLISLRHETTVAHVRDAGGVLEHAHALAEFHEHSTTQHLHGNGAHDHADVGPCALLVGLEHSTIVTKPPAIGTIAPSLALAHTSAPPLVETGISVLALAPKTSPPALG